MRRTYIGRISLLAVLFTALTSCAKISKFDEPYMLETFLVALAITPSLKGPSAGAVASAAVTIVGDETGETVTLFGVPTNEPFHIIPEKLAGQFPVNVSGLTAEVIDSHTLKVNGFAQMSYMAEEYEATVSGTVVREGPRLATTEDDPIVIEVRARPLINVLKKKGLLRFISFIGSDEKIDEIDGDDMIGLYEVRIGGDVMSIL